MKPLKFCRGALGLCAVALLAACGVRSQPPLAPSVSYQQRGAQAHLDQLPGSLANTSNAAATGVKGFKSHDPSWMLAEAKSEALLYVANYNSGTVGVYSYPNGKLVGTLATDVASPDGLCLDKNNDIWIANNAPSAKDLVEYQKGGTTPIATLRDPSQYATDCAIDPVTGNLAVTNHGSLKSGSGSISIYKHAKGLPKMYFDSPMFHMYWCAYDSKGNLYVDGTDQSETQFLFAEMPNGTTKFKNITLTGGTIKFPGSIQQVGRYIEIGDQITAYGSQGQDISAIYRTTGAGGKIVGVTPLTNSDDVPGYWIDGSTIVAPDFFSHDPSEVAFYPYPAGGDPTKALKKGFDGPIAALVSP